MNMKDKKVECFVLNCNNEVGVPFPKNENLKNEWLKVLNENGTTDIELNESSFICLDHFNDGDFEDGPGEDRKLKEDAIPSKITTKLEEDNNIFEQNDGFSIEVSDKDTKIEECRLCMCETDVNLHSIYNNLDENESISIMTAIKMCLHPLKIEQTDEYSKKICSKCLASLKSSYIFKTFCLTVDGKRRKPNIEMRKRKNSDLQDLEENTHKPKVQLIGPYPKLDTNLDKSIKLTTITNNRQLEIDRKFDKVEAELRRVLEGKLTEEQICAENIIMVVTSDDEDDNDKPTKIMLPIKENPKNEHNQNVEKDTIISANNSKIVLPKGIRVTVSEKYESDIGVFKCSIKEYVFGTIFCKVDGYLFEFRLEKGLFRYLRCIHNNCRSTGKQTKNSIEENYDNLVKIETPHNHPKPSEQEAQKQMFYYVIKQKIRADRTLSFRTIYDDVCACDPKIRELIPLRNVINEMCRYQLSYKCPDLESFDDFYNHIEEDTYQRLHYTCNNKQFYQERFFDEQTNSKAIIFANCEVIRDVSYSSLMYVDASFKIDSDDKFYYQLLTVLVWVEESCYPILFAVINKKTQEIYRKIFEYLHDILAPKLRPTEIVTDYEGNLYYALGETYLDSHIGGSVFYYTQNLYKKICNLKLSRDLETNSYFRNIYHMLLMLPLLPVNTILDGLENIQIQANELGLTELTQPLFEHIQKQWIEKVTPDLFCVHRLENRINENVIAPFKKLRDFLMLTKGKIQKQSPTTIVQVIEKLIELDGFLQQTYSAPTKKSFARDLSCSQKKNVLRAWQYIEHHPKININNFFSKVLGYIKCMENQLWIWGFYRYKGDVSDELINAANFSIVSNDFDVEVEETIIENDNNCTTKEEEHNYDETQIVEEKIVIEENDTILQEPKNHIVVDGVIDENGQIVVKECSTTPFENAFVKYIYNQ